MYGSLQAVAMAGDAGSAMAFPFPPGSPSPPRRPPRVPEKFARSRSIRESRAMQRDPEISSALSLCVVPSHTEASRVGT